MPMAAKGLAKLIEECGELMQVAGKKLAYYHTDEHPDGEGPLSLRLEDEIADVLAACSFVTITMCLNEARIGQRSEVKLKRFVDWHYAPENNVHGVDRG